MLECCCLSSFFLSSCLVSSSLLPPSPTLSPTDPLPRGLLTLCPAASSGPQGLYTAYIQPIYSLYTVYRGESAPCVCASVSVAQCATECDIVPAASMAIPLAPPPIAPASEHTHTSALSLSLALSLALSLSLSLPRSLARSFFLLTLPGRALGRARALDRRARLPLPPAIPHPRPRCR